jgi:hypothetical protein
MNIREQFGYLLLKARRRRPGETFRAAGPHGMEQVLPGFNGTGIDATLGAASASGGPSIRPCLPSIGNGVDLARSARRAVRRLRLHLRGLAALQSRRGGGTT